MTSKGVNASISASLALVNAITSEAKTLALANELGIPKWDDEHRSADFKLSGKLPRKNKTLTMSILKNSRVLFDLRNTGASADLGVP